MLVSFSASFDSERGRFKKRERERAGCKILHDGDLAGLRDPLLRGEFIFVRRLLLFFCLSATSNDPRFFGAIPLTTAARAYFHINLEDCQNSLDRPDSG